MFANVASTSSERGECFSRFGQEPLGGFGPLLRRRVLPDIDRIQDVARGVGHRRGADNRPALFAGLLVAEAEGDSGLGLALERPAARQVLYRERLAILVEESEPSHDLGDRCGEELGRIGKPQRSGGRGVGIDKPPTRILDGDAVTDVIQEDREVVRRVLHGRDP